MGQYLDNQAETAICLGCGNTIGISADNWHTHCPHCGTGSNNWKFIAGVRAPDEPGSSSGSGAGAIGLAMIVGVIWFFTTVDLPWWKICWAAGYAFLITAFMKAVKECEWTSKLNWFVGVTAFYGLLYMFASMYFGIDPL